MLKRIKNIKNIGTLSNVHAAKHGFGKFTIIYGANSYGKSTLCDIFVSLRDNDNTSIEKRKTVNSKDAPMVSFAFSKDSHEIDVQYKNHHWEKDGFCEALEIFDTNFVHRNVFTNNSEIDQTNKTNLTEFIIGEAAIVAAKALQKLNDEKNDIDRTRKTLEDKVVKCGYAMADLIKIPYKEDITLEDTLCLSLKTTIADQRKSKENIDIIKKSPLPTSFKSIPESNEEFEKINGILSSEFTFEADDLLEKFEEHKAKHLASIVGADDWLHKGTEYSKNGICPFCGQSIVGNDLISSYFVIFSNKFKSYNESIKLLHINKIDSGSLDRLRLQSEQNEKAMGGICGKILNAQLNSIKDEAITLTEKLLDASSDYFKVLEDVHEQLERQIEEKLKDKYKPVVPVSLNLLTESHNKAVKVFGAVNEKLKEFCNLAQAELADLSIETIDKKIHEMEKEYADAEKVFYRNKYNAEIEDYIRLGNERTGNRRREKEQKEEFDNQQKIFLDNFFKDIEAYFSKLGSRDYSIEREDVSKGIKKTYSIKLFYKGEAIPPADIKYVLSESDKRALALSIFLSKLKRSKSANTIVILDDPISSFDIDRMQAFTNTLKEFCNDVSQIIILTHYKNFYKTLAGWTSKYFTDMSLLKIIRNCDSNDFENIDKEADTLLMDEFQENLFEMVSFIQGKTQFYNAVSARVFMEKYLKYYFMLEIKERNLQFSNLDSLLESLRDNRLITQELYRQLDVKREEYNSPAHDFESYTIEAKRSSLKELYDLLHKIQAV